MTEPREIGAELHATLQREDHIGVVIRAQIHIERLVNELIETVVPYPEHLEKMQLDYSQRVSLALSVGLRSDLAPPLQALGKLRNRFAHTEKDKIESTDANNLYNALSAFDKEAFEIAFNATKKAAPDGLSVKTAANLEPKDKFILCFITLRTPLILAREEGAAYVAAQQGVQRDGP